MTAFVAVKNVVKYIKIDSVAYLQKTFTADKVRSVLNKILENKSNGAKVVVRYIQRGRKLVDGDRLDEAFAIIKRALEIDLLMGI